MSWFDTFSPAQDMMAQEGLNFLSAGTNYMAAKEQASAKQKWQAYSNSMANISNAITQNTLSINETNAVRTEVDANANIQRGDILYSAQEAVKASAAGVQGKSVNQALTDIHNNAAQRESNNQIDLNNQLQGYAQQRQESQMKALEAQNYSFIPSPNPGTYLMGALNQNSKLEANVPQNTPSGNDANFNNIIWNSQ